MRITLCTSETPNAGRRLHHYTATYQTAHERGRRPSNAHTVLLHDAHEPPLVSRPSFEAVTAPEHAIRDWAAVITVAGYPKHL